jgi:hypothetical protein
MEDDSPDGRITLSAEGVHFAPRVDSYTPLYEITSSHTHSSFIRDFEEDVFFTSLTPTLQPPQRDAVSMVLNAFAHASGLEVGSFFDASATHISAKMRQYKREPSDLMVQKIPPALVGNEIAQSCTVSTGARL